MKTKKIIIFKLITSLIVKKIKYLKNRALKIGMPGKTENRVKACMIKPSKLFLHSRAVAPSSSSSLGGALLESELFRNFSSIKLDFICSLLHCNTLYSTSNTFHCQYVSSTLQLRMASYETAPVIESPRGLKKKKK